MKKKLKAVRGMEVLGTGEKYYFLKSVAKAGLSDQETGHREKA